MPVGIATQLTLLRIALAPIIMYLVIWGEGTPEWYWLAAALLAVAAATDWLDGFVARRRNTVSAVGASLDLVADKVLVAVVLIALVQVGLLPGWWAAVVISREMAVTGLRAQAAAKAISIPAGRVGKLKTGVTFIALVALLVWQSIVSDVLPVARPYPHGLLRRRVSLQRHSPIAGSRQRPRHAQAIANSTKRGSREMKVAFVGLGTMGMHMAVNLRQAGHDVYAFNRTRSKAEAFAASGGTLVESPREGAERADFVLSCVSMPEDVEEVFLGEAGRGSRVAAGTGVCGPQHHRPRHRQARRRRPRGKTDPVYRCPHQRRADGRRGRYARHHGGR